MKQLLLIITCLFTISIQQNLAQNGTNTNVQLDVIDLGNNRFQFDFELPPISQVTSATPPHYSYYMNYGDGFVEFGHFKGSSNTISLFHTYDSIPTEEIMYRVYNNYSNGTPPPDEKINIDGINGTATAANIEHNSMMSGNDDNGVKIQPTFYPRKNGMDGPFRIQPEDNIALILAYKNQLADMANGQLVLLFDKKQFAINQTQTYHYETKINTDDIQGLERDIDIENTGILAWKINQLPRDQEQQIILDLNVLPERLAKETTFRLMFIPQDGSAEMANVMNDEIQMSILEERDPNKMSGKINKQFFKKEDYNYTIQFFNEGDGPVTDITLEIKEMHANWNNSKFEITRMNIAGIEVAKENFKSKYVLQNQKNIVVLKLRDVRLEGLNADDLEKVEHAYATIDFKIEPKKDWKATKAQTSIIFSDKAPVITNTVPIFPQNRFFLGLEAGYAYDFIDADPLARDEGLFFRGVTGWRFTDRTSVAAEFGFSPSFTETENDNSSEKQSYFINPQVVFRLNTWWKASAGVSMLRQNASNYSNNVFVSSTIDDSFRFLVDTHITPVQNRFFNVNIGARYYQPFNNKFTNSVQAYATLRVNILE